VSPRRNRPRGRQQQPQPNDEGPRYGIERVDEWRGEEWVVRRVSGGAAAKRYRCPGCDQEIPPGVPHVVAWPRLGGVDDRRHWHRACWDARDRRGAKPPRSRNVPRF
jgi:hypothetical protein